MKLQSIIEGKKEWNAHKSRIKSLPRDYQIVYSEIQKYLYKVGPTELYESITLLTGIIDLFEEGANLGKDVLEVTGQDIANFCDELIKDSKTYFDQYQESIDLEISKAMIKVTDKTK